MDSYSPKFGATFELTLNITGDWALALDAALMSTPSINRFRPGDAEFTWEGMSLRVVWDTTTWHVFRHDNPEQYPGGWCNINNGLWGRRLS